MTRIREGSGLDFIATGFFACFASLEVGEGWGVTRNNGLYEEAPFKWSTFFRFQVY